MIVQDKYTYLTAVLIALVPWAILFLRRKDLRKKMITMSILVTLFGLFAEYFWWSRDWWHPPTVTGTRIGIEDILNGIVTGGITAVLYEEIFKKKFYKRKSKPHNFGALVIGLIFFLISGFLFYALQIPSFISSTIAFVIAGFILIIQRRDLITDAFLTGVCLIIGIFPFYLILNFISPHYIENIWVTSNLSGIRFIGDPIEDIIFYFFFGFLIGPFYLYWKGEKLRRIIK